MDSGHGALLILLSTVVGLLSGERLPRCTQEELQRCLDALQAVTQREDLALAETREELIAGCQKLQQGVRCVEDHTARCFTSAQKRLFNSVVSESRQVIQALCVSGELQDDYLRYAPCFKNISKDERKCSQKYRQIVEVSETTDQDTSEEGLRKTCCAVTEFVMCQFAHVVNDCGPNAGLFLQRQVERMSGPLMNQHCAVYTHDSGACNSPASRPWLPPLEVLLLLPPTISAVVTSRAARAH